MYMVLNVNQTFGGGGKIRTYLGFPPDLQSGATRHRDRTPDKNNYNPK